MPRPCLTHLRFPHSRDWCTDEASCLQRTHLMPEATSSQGWPVSLSLGGLFAPSGKKNPLAGANKAFLGYCSSDAWQGDTPAGGSNAGLAFRGQRIVRATLAALVSQHGLGSSLTKGKAGKPDRLLLAGGAAGGRGAILLLDHLAGWLTGFGGVAPGAVMVQGLFDAALWIPVQPLGSSGVDASLASQVERSIGLFNSSNLASPACTGSMAAVTLQWQCLFPNTALAYVTTPFLLAQPQFDKRQLGVDLHGAQPPFGPTSPQAVYAVQLAAAIRTASAPALRPGSGNALFSAACYKAATTLSPQLWGVRAAAMSPAAPMSAVSLAQVLTAWFFTGASGVSVSAQDECNSFACGAFCRRNAGHARSSSRTPRASNHGASTDAVLGGVSRSGTKAASSAAVQRNKRMATAGLVVLMVAVPAVCAMVLTQLIPVRTGVRLSLEERVAAAEGTPLRPVMSTGLRSSLHSWAEQEAEAKRRSQAGSRAQVLNRFYSGTDDGR